MNNNDRFVNYTCLESLLIEGEEIATEGILSSIFSKKKPDNMPDNELITYWVSTVDAKSGKTKSISIMYSDRKEKNINYNTMLNYVTKNYK